MDMGAMVRAYDPIGIEQARQTLAGIEFCDGPYACAKGADALVIVTEWEQFRALDFERLKAVMKRAVLVDLRNVYRPEDLDGFAYHGVGRGGSVG
jgi:UDPglucose 6-dehydrogenase